ncbi:hypothetical protein KKC91_00410 [bacterium]|nr:hypothetical protein [bacterium]
MCLTKNGKFPDNGLRSPATNVTESRLDANLLKQEKLSGVFSDGLLAIEAYRKQIIPLRDEERDLKARVKRFELSLIEKERSEEYKKLLESIVNHLDTIEADLDIAGKKGILRLVFKSIRIKNGRIKDFELYNPFKSLYEGVNIKCQLKETEQVMTIPESVSTYALSDVR